MPPESPRIAELRRRVEADPASIAFAQLAEEYRRAGSYQDAVNCCRSGLNRHPGYLSARVTLGRALIELGGLDDAAREFELVLKSAPDNLAAIRGLAEIHQRCGDLQRALEYYQRALALARFDPELEETVNRIGREMRAAAAPSAHEGLSFEQATSELLSAASRVPAASPPGSEPPNESGPTVATDAPAPGHVETEPRSGTVAEPLIDFDALLASLGAPGAVPPPLVEMLLSPVTSPTAPPGPHAPPPPAATSTPAIPSAPDPAVAALVEELQSWLRVLETERAAQGV